ncbi:hypothetical protein HDV06_005475 [Boothiomyces sp. JEL0866]|nr:hypothetical protein HDV06_005475 [Boothiomyces sp. JEL0866]
MKPNIPQDQCCHSIINSTSYQSFGGSYDSEYPKTVNSQYYCKIALAGKEYDYGYFLANNQCFDNFKCDLKTKTLALTNNCQSVLETFDLDSKNQTSNHYGSIKVDLVQLQGNTTFVWTTFNPSWLFIPVNKDPLEIVGTICEILGIATSFLMSIYYTRRVIIKPSMINIAITFLSGFWCAKSIVHMTIEYTIATNYTLQQLVFIATLPLYMEALAELGLLLVCDYSLLNTINNWAEISSYINIIFWFLFATFTTLYITLSILRYDDRFRKQNLLAKMVIAFADSNLMYPLLAEIVFILLYFFIKTVGSYSLIAGNHC